MRTNSGGRDDGRHRAVGPGDDDGGEPQHALQRIDGARVERAGGLHHQAAAEPGKRRAGGERGERHGAHVDPGCPGPVRAVARGPQRPSDPAVRQHLDQPEAEQQADQFERVERAAAADRLPDVEPGGEARLLEDETAGDRAHRERRQRRARGRCAEAPDSR